MFKNKVFYEEKFASIIDYFYICMCVFHSIRFKVNKVLGVAAATLFCFYPLLDD